MPAEINRRGVRPKGATGVAQAASFSGVRSAETATQTTCTAGPRHPVGASHGATAFGDALSVAVLHSLCRSVGLCGSVDSRFGSGDMRSLEQHLWGTSVGRRGPPNQSGGPSDDRPHEEDHNDDDEALRLGWCATLQPCPSGGPIAAANLRGCSSSRDEANSYVSRCHRRCCQREPGSRLRARDPRHVYM